MQRLLSSFSPFLVNKISTWSSKLELQTSNLRLQTSEALDGQLVTGWAHAMLVLAPWNMLLSQPTLGSEVAGRKSGVWTRDMHKRIERILIAAAVLIAGAYALISFWPVDTTPVASPPSPPGLTREQSTETVADRKRVEAHVVASLINIGSAELSFRGLKKRFGTTDELVRENLLSKKYSDGVIIEGYQYTVVATAAQFAVWADPAPGPGRHYFIDETLDLRYDDNGRASSSSLYLSYIKNQPSSSTPPEPTNPPKP